MKNFSKTAPLLALLFLMATAFAAYGADVAPGNSPTDGTCTPVHPDITTITDGVLDVHVYVSPTYTTRSPDGFGGIDVAIVRELAAMECLDLKMKSVSGAGLIAGIQAGRADLAIGGIKYTPQRAQVLALSIPMYRDGVSFISIKELDGSIAALNGKNVGIIQGYFFTGDLTSALGEDRITIYQDASSMIFDIRAGRIIAGVLDTATTTYFASKNSRLNGVPITPTARIPASLQKNLVVLAGYPEQPELIDALNEDIKAMIDSGRIADILADHGLNPVL